MHKIGLCSFAGARTSCRSAMLLSLGVTFALILVGCGGGDSGTDPLITPPGGSGSTASSSTASISLAWDPVPDPSVYAYFVHYGKQGTSQPGSCNYTYSTYVGSPTATITDLDPNTVYYFAVSAYNGEESTCSNEVSTVTQSAA